MNETIKAILYGRFGGDLMMAVAYCRNIMLDAATVGNSALSNEYADLALKILGMLEAEREQLQRTRTVLAAGCSA